MKVSVVIITIVRENLYTLVKQILEQDVNFDFEVVLIPQPKGKLERDNLPHDDRVKIFEEDMNKGFGYYRQLGVDKSHGEVIVWIDDDQNPMNNKWLASISRSIIEGKEKVTTSGIHIPLGQGYITDSISWLGFPGGGYPGFKVMWKVDEDNYTGHLCTGNFAIERQILLECGGFSHKQKSGNEDVELSDRLKEKHIKFLYVPEATVYHEARGSLADFTKWHIERGAGHQDLKKSGKMGGGKIKNGLRSALQILRMSLFTKYFPMVLFLTTYQFFLQFLGFLGVFKRSYRYYENKKDTVS
ncbi:glycosyltransferase family 2 protein [Candidatus Dojkabacteria bacterium]|nr:glycosyltransferase family 2 protein [Candidatus Dojkabacteria bacterium]